MTHKYNRKDPRDLVFIYERLIKQGSEANLRVIDYLNLITHLEKEYTPTDALEATEFALSKYRFSSRLYTRKAQLLINNNQEEYAFEALDKAEILGQSFIETDLLRAQAYLSLEENEEAQQIITELKYDYHTTKTERSNVLFVEALIHESSDEFEDMFYCLKKAVLLNPFNEDALQKLYLAVELSKKHEESILLHQKVLDENPYSHTAWFNLAQAHYSLREYEESLDAFEFSFITNERFEPAYKEYAEVCFHLNLYQKALDAMNEAMAHFTADDEFLLKVGQCYEYLGETAKAKIFYYRALAQNKLADEVYYHIGECYTKEGEFESSVHFYKQAIRIEDMREDYLIALAKAYAFTGRYQKALPLFKKATEMGPELSENWVEYAWFLVKLDGLEEALEVIEESEDYSYGANIYYLKAAILFKLKNRRSALTALGEALGESYKDNESFFNYLPEYRNDKDVNSILRYYAVEA